MIKDDTKTSAELKRYGIDLAGFIPRAARAYLRSCEDAATVLLTMEGQPERPAERWAKELSDREPAVSAIMRARKTNQP